MNFQEIRQKYPDYQDMSDEQFAQKFHQKFYGDMSFEDFSSKVGYSKEPSFLDKAIGVGEAGLNLLSAGTTGAVAGAVGGAQGILDSIREGTFGTKEGLSNAENKFIDQMQTATYEPRTQTGKKYANEAGDWIMQNAPALVAVAPQLEQLSAINSIRKTQKAIANSPVSPANTAVEELLNNRKSQEPSSVEMPRTQTELDLGQPNQFGHRPSEFTIDENGIPIRRNASLEAQETVRQGDLFSLQNQANELRNDVINRAEPATEGFPANRDYLKAQEEELAYQQKAAQDRTIPQEQLFEPEQRSQTAPPEDQVPLGQRGFGRGQRGAIDPDVFLKDFPEFVNSKVVNALGKLAQVYHGTTEEIKGEFKTYKGFKNFYKDVGGLDKDGFIRTPERAYSGDIGTWFSSTPKGTDTFAGARTGVKGGNVHPVYLNLKNPKVFETHGDYIKWFNSVTEDGSSASKARRSLIKQGHDGIQIKDSRTDAGGLRTDWVAFHPQQIESTLSPTRPIGQTKVGKSQRGSIGFFGKDPFEKFSDEIKSKIPDATPEEIQKVWDNQQQLQQKQQVAKSLGKINPKLQANLSIYRDVDRSSALQAIASSADSDVSNLGFMRNQVLSRGRLGLEKIKNEGVKSGLAYMIGLHDQGGIKANEILHGPEGILRDLRKQEALFTEGKAGEVLRQRQEAQFNPDYKFNFTPEQAKINDKITKVFDDIRSEMERLTGKTIHEVPNYFPSMFYGPFAVEIRDAGGKLVAFVTEKSAKEARKAASEVVSSLGSEFTVSEPKFRREITSQGFKNRAGLAPYFEAMLDLLSSDDPSVLKAQESVQRVVAKRAMDTQQMQNRMKFKAGVKGAEGEKSWKSPTENYRDAKDVLENYIRGFEEWKANMESAKFVNDVKDLNVPNTYNILQDYFDNLRGVRDSSNKFARDLETGLAKSGYDISKLATTAARKSAGLLTKAWLGFWNPAAMIQNTLQPLAAFPKLIELASAGGSKDVLTPFIIGMAKSMQDGYELIANKTTGKPLGQRMQYMRENEVIKPGLVEAENRTKVGHYMEKGLVSGGLLTTEAFARATTFNIFETYLKNSGYSLEEARSLAKNLTHDYQVNYENYAKSGAIANSGIVGELAGRLQSYKINQMTQLANYLMELKQNKNPAPIASFVMMSIAMAGISGMIGMDVAEGIYGLMVKAGLIDPDTRSPRQMAMDLGGAAATGIPSAVTGKWLSGSLTTNLIGDMSWRNIAPIFAGLIDTGSKLPIASKWAKDVITGEHSLPMSEKAQLLQAVTPTSLRGRWEDRLLTDPEGRVSSPYTGQVSYVKGPQDQDLLSKFTNLRSKERGEAISRQALLKNQEANIKAEIDSRTKKLEKLFDESVRMNKPLSEQVLNREIQRILDLGGDPATTISQINNFIVKNHMGDWFEQQVASGKINLGSVNRKLRAMNEREQLYGR